METLIQRQKTTVVELQKNPVAEFYSFLMRDKERIPTMRLKFTTIPFEISGMRYSKN